MPKYCPDCGNNGMYYIHGLSTPRTDNNSRQLVYFCQSCKQFIAYQKIESGNPDLNAVFRVTVVKPIGRAKDSANKELLPRIGKKVFA